MYTSQRLLIWYHSRIGRRDIHLYWTRNSCVLNLLYNIPNELHTVFGGYWDLNCRLSSTNTHSACFHGNASDRYCLRRWLIHSPISLDMTGFCNRVMVHQNYNDRSLSGVTRYTNAMHTNVVQLVARRVCWWQWLPVVVIISSASTCLLCHLSLVLFFPTFSFPLSVSLSPNMSYDLHAWSLVGDYCIVILTVLNTLLWIGDIHVHVLNFNGNITNCNSIYQNCFKVYIDTSTAKRDHLARRNSMELRKYVYICQIDIPKRT
jgi:hypothetical protein